MAQSMILPIKRDDLIKRLKDRRAEYVKEASELERQRKRDCAAYTKALIAELEAMIKACKSPAEGPDAVLWPRDSDHHNYISDPRYKANLSDRYRTRESCQLTQAIKELDRAIAILELVTSQTIDINDRKDQLGIAQAIREAF